MARRLLLILFLAFGGTGTALAQDQRLGLKDFFSAFRDQQAQGFGRGAGHLPSDLQAHYSRLNPSIRAKIQESLVWIGSYPGPIDGEIGERTIAAVRVFQRSIGAAETGTLTTQQFTALQERAEHQIRQSGFRTIADRDTGLIIGIPNAFVLGPKPNRFGSDYFSSDGRIQIGLRAFRIAQDIRSEFERLKSSSGEGAIEYATLKDDWFVIAGSINSRKYYQRFHGSNGILAGFFAVYDDSAPQFPIPLSMMSFSLRAFVTPPSPGLVALQPDANRLIEPIAIIRKEIAPQIGGPLIPVLPAPVSEGTLWDHNDAVVRLVSQGDKRRFVYEVPNLKLKLADVSKGTVLFEGRRVGEFYEGIAFSFKTGCQPIPYRMTGKLISEEEVVVFGAAPIVSSTDCRILEFRTDVAQAQLRFVFRKDDINQPKFVTASVDTKSKDVVDSPDKVLLESIQKFLERTPGAAPKFYRYVVPKNEAAGITKDAPILRIVFEERVFFDTAKDEILPEAASALAEVAEALRSQAIPAALFVAGHTDSRGSDDYNMELSMRRAHAVAQALIVRGVGATPIWQVGFGKAVPLRPNDSDANMATNRRVEFLLATQPKAIATWIATVSPKLCEGEKCDPNANVGRKFIAVPATLQAPPAEKIEPQVKTGQTTTAAPIGSAVTIPEMRPIELELKALITEVGTPKL